MPVVTKVTAPVEEVKEKKGRGRPMGSKNKIKHNSTASSMPQEKKQRGRPIGSKNKPKNTIAANDIQEIQETLYTFKCKRGCEFQTSIKNMEANCGKHQMIMWRQEGTTTR